MVTHMSRKRRSKRHMKRYSKRYSKHSKTRIRRNMYRKKHKKTQRGGELIEDYTSGVQLPPGWEIISTKNVFGQIVYKDPDNKLHLDHPNPYASNAQARLSLDGNLDDYSYSMLEDLRINVKEKCKNYLKIIDEKELSKISSDKKLFKDGLIPEKTDFSKSKESKKIMSGE